MLTLNEKWKQRTDRLTAFIPFIVCYVFSVVLPFMVYAFSGSKNLCVNENYENTLSTLDYFYYSVVTLTTLGYGDIYPCSATTKWTVIFQSIAGPALIGLLLVSIANDINKRREEKNTKIEREKVFDTTQLFFRKSYYPCILFLNAINFGRCIKKKYVCFASRENHWSSIETYHHDRQFTEDAVEAYLLFYRDHMSTVPTCTANHIEFLESARLIFLDRLTRVIYSMQKSHVVSECYVPEILSLLERTDGMKYIAEYVVEHQHHSPDTVEAINSYLNEYWLLVVFTLRFMDTLNASPAITIIDPHEKEFKHPFGDSDLEMYVNRDWTINKGIFIYKELGESITGT